MYTDIRSGFAKIRQNSFVFIHRAHAQIATAWSEKERSTPVAHMRQLTFASVTCCVVLCCVKFGSALASVDTQKLSIDSVAQMRKLPRPDMRSSSGCFTGKLNKLFDDKNLHG